MAQIDEHRFIGLLRGLGGDEADLFASLGAPDVGGEAGAGVFVREVRVRDVIDDRPESEQHG